MLAMIDIMQNLNIEFMFLAENVNKEYLAGPR
jgi:hypothetical protein